MKVARVNGHIRQATPEYEDCRKLAVEKDVPLQTVIAAAQKAFDFAGTQHAAPGPGAVKT
jgi:uncharacterized protein (DUF111 family)